MASSTGHPGAISRETYWKRRAFVLTGALLVLVLITMIMRACSTSAEESGEPTRSEAGVDASPSPSVPPEESSEAESDKPGTEESEGTEASPSPSEGAEDAEGTEGSGGGEGGGDGGGEVAAPKRPEDACRPQDVVITFDLAEGKEVYGAGASPSFEITVVNTEEQTCTVDVGGSSMEVRIHSGDDRIYSTADCLEGDGAEERQISRGVPHEYTLTWERERSFEDCRDSGSSARPGWYRANLHGDYVQGVGELPFQLKA